MQTIAITGGGGFVGRHLVRRHVEAGDRVRVLSRRPLSVEGAEVVRGDLASGEIPERFVADADVLYHCAGEISRAEHMRKLHVDGTRSLLRAARGRIGAWVQLSSVGVYGPRHHGIVSESDPINPKGPYEVTKAESDALIEAADIPYTILRPSTVFSHDMPNHSLRRLVSMIERGLFFFIGPPGAVANYIHVENVVDALRLCSKPMNTSFNLSDCLPLEEFVAVVAEAVGRKSPQLRLPAAPVRLFARLPGLPLTNSRIDALTTRVVYPTTKIVKELGYRHRLSFREALFDFVERGR